MSGALRIDNQIDLIWRRDWKNLIILDACRYDAFKLNNTISGTLKPVWSPASYTSLWIEKVFTPLSWKDTVLVTASAFFRKRILEKFHYVHNCILKNWNDSYSTVLPEDVTRVTKKLLAVYPDHPFVIWYIQPHVPLIGEPEISVRTLDLRKDANLSLEKFVKIFKIPEETVRKAYISNLRYVLGFVKELLLDLHGKTIITADHGNALGEFGYWGHMFSQDFPFLRVVPWLEVKK